MDVKLALVVARGANDVIGSDGDLPWKLSSDLKRFKEITLGKPVVMGRKTWASIGRPLPGRPNLVVTRDANFKAAGAAIYSNLDVAIAAARAMARASGVGEVCIIGGGELYAQTIAIADRLYLTDVKATPEGDAVFPSFHAADWHETAHEEFAPGPKDDHAFTIRVLERTKTNPQNSAKVMA
jgi:dihydrofolate reductase